MNNEHKQTPIVRCQSLLALHNQLTSRRNLMCEKVNTIEQLVEHDFTDNVISTAESMEVMYNDLCEEVIHLSVFEPGLRYWMQKSWPFHVWASTLDEPKAREGLSYCDGGADEIQEIDFTDYQELRKQEYASLTPTVPQHDPDCAMLTTFADPVCDCKLSTTIPTTTEETPNEVTTKETN